MPMVLWHRVSQYSGVARQAQPATPSTVTTTTAAMTMGRRLPFQFRFFLGAFSGAAASVVSLISSAMSQSPLETALRR